jgi:hypothetical protein
VLGEFQIVAVRAAGLNAFSPRLLFSAGHNVHHEPPPIAIGSARRIFTASRSDLPIAIGSASFVIVVTLHYQALG